MGTLRLGLFRKAEGFEVKKSRPVQGKDTNNSKKPLKPKQKGQAKGSVPERGAGNFRKNR